MPGFLKITPKGSKNKHNFKGLRTEPEAPHKQDLAKSDKIPSIRSLCVRPQNMTAVMHYR